MIRLLFLLFLACSVNAELLIVTKSSSTPQVHIPSVFAVNQRINDTVYLAVGSAQTTAAGLTVKVIDTDFYSEYRYFILYKRVYNPTVRLPAGSEQLVNTDSYSVFRTKDYESPFSTDYMSRTYSSVPIRFFNLAANEAKPVAVDHKIEQIRDFVNCDSLMNRLGELQKMERYAQNPNAEKTAEYLVKQMESMGFDSIYYHRFDSLYSPTVIAEKRGSANDSLVVVTCHYDSYAEGAAAADDNGSGTSGVLEIARVVTKFKTEKTVRVIFFSGEEKMLYGSKCYTESLQPKELSTIAGVVNLDMIGHLNKGRTLELQVVSDDQSRSFFKQFCAASAAYLPEIPIFDGYYSPLSHYHDGASFWKHGIPGISMSDDEDPSKEPHPAYHKEGDTIGFGVNSPEYLTANVKAAAVFTAVLAGMSEVSAVSPVKLLRRSVFTMKGSKLLAELGQPEAMLEIFDLRGKLLMSSRVSDGSSVDLSRFAHMVVLCSVHLKSGTVHSLIKL